MIAAHIYTS